MSITTIREVITGEGGTPASYAQVPLVRELITTLGGTPTQYGYIPLLRELVTEAGGTPTQQTTTGMLRELVTALGGTPATYNDDLLWVQVQGLGFEHTLTPVTFTDSFSTTFVTDHYETSGLARTVFTTTATELTINGYTSYASLFGAPYAELGVVVDGVHLDSITSASDGMFSGDVTLAAGTKTVEIINGMQSNSGTLKGTWLVSVTANAAMTQTFPSSANKTAFLVDSIGGGAFAYYPTKNGYFARLRDVTTDNFLAVGYGFATMQGIAGSPTTLANQLVAAGVTRVVNTLGVNDYGLSGGLAATFQTREEAFNDAWNVANPTGTIIAVTMIPASGEGANGSGSTLGDFRAARTAAAVGRAWVTVVDGTTLCTAGDLGDGLHPTTYGHFKIAQVLDSALGLAAGPFSQVALYNAPDINGAVSQPSAGVYRAAKSAGGASFNAGFVGQEETGDFLYRIEPITAQDTIFGFNTQEDANAGSAFSDMSAMLYITPISIKDYSGGVEGAILSSFTLGDIVWVDRVGTTITYRLGHSYAESLVLKTATLAGTIVLDMSMFTVGGTVDITIPATASGSVLQTPMHISPTITEGSVSLLSAGVSRVTKIAGGNNFTAGGFYGPQRTGDFRYSIAVPALCQTFIGVDGNASAGVSYTTIDHSVYLLAGGTIEGYDGASGLGGLGSYTAGATIWVDRTGTTVTFKVGATYAGATTLRTQTKAGTIALDIQIYAVGVLLDVTAVS